MVSRCQQWLAGWLGRSLRRRRLLRGCADARWVQPDARPTHPPRCPTGEEAAPLHWLLPPAVWALPGGLLALAGLEPEDKQALFPKHAQGSEYPSNSLVAARLQRPGPG